ncbi:forkhead box protein R2 [Canis lupus baileyi]|uniref:Forkhead box R2 n=2 Tax=Canis lupus familiaris TaxID=9615 RepID=A0A8C0NIF8_CANLF|nr:forkhead box protein R2 [Canis lupus familiaris]XP_038304884.1 forkhead box protein R2 [Canis lupus familiaris]XP_038442440.1 forkhead box protein R2 [Canis lupus familiaris]XP_048963364.1 forkhead box protein R2 [Canis lupus dingo]|eukprot:XP_022271800.1 forkhead box protein R2 [Canis lupus familiaris]
MDIKLKNPDFWYSLHGQVPGLLDWDMGNELFLPSTTDQCHLTEQNLAQYRLRVMEPPKVPQERRTSPDKDGPDSKPNLWMWVNPNIMCPLGSQETLNPSKEKDLTSMLPYPQPLPKNESNCSKATVMESLTASSSKKSSPQKRFIYPPSDWELTKEETEEQENNCSVSLQSPNKRECFQNQKLWQGNSQERKSWPRPPLNYSHLIALALRNSPPCGLNVQEIYNFTRQHFPFFWTAPNGWKNTIRHNLCFLGSFEKAPVNLQNGTHVKPRSGLWRLTEEGHRRFQEETRALASARRESIQQCMSQPDVMTSLFGL